MILYIGLNWPIRDHLGLTLFVSLIITIESMVLASLHSMLVMTALRLLSLDTWFITLCCTKWSCAMYARVEHFLILQWTCVVFEICHSFWLWLRFPKHFHTWNKTSVSELLVILNWLACPWLHSDVMVWSWCHVTHSSVSWPYGACVPDICLVRMHQGCVHPLIQWFFQETNCLFKSYWTMKVLYCQAVL